MPSIGNGVNQTQNFSGQMSQYSPRNFLKPMAKEKPGFQRLYQWMVNNQHSLEGAQQDANLQFRAGPNDIGEWQYAIDTSIVWRGPKVHNIQLR